MPGADQAVTLRDAARRLHPVPVRVTHWINAVTMIVMIASGWGIYDDGFIIRGLHFGPAFRLGDRAAWSLNWHFAGMWFLALNGLAYLVHGVLTGRLPERLLPIRRAGIVHTVRDTLRLRIAHDDLATYDAVQAWLFDPALLAPTCPASAVLRPPKFDAYYDVTEVKADRPGAAGVAPFRTGCFHRISRRDMLRRRTARG